MLHHYLLQIFRNFKRFKVTFVINLIGLSTGLASATLIYLWVADELRVDAFHQKGDRLFQVMETKTEGGAVTTSANTTDFLAAALLDEMPEIENTTVVTPPNFFPSFTLSAADHHVKGVGKFASREFFDLFSYDLTIGSATDVLKDKSSAVVSESLAKSLFGTATNSIGKSLTWQIMGLKKDVLITGVFQDVSQHASEQFDFVLHFDALKEIIGIQGAQVNWEGGGPFSTFVVIKDGADVVHLNSKLGNYLGVKSKNASHRQLFLKQFSDRYLYGQYENGEATGGRIEYVVLFSTIAIFILVIASINFMNLSTATAARKAKGAGIKKVLGAERKTLVFQYLSEAFVVTALSVGLAMVITALVLPQFNVLSGKHLALSINIESAAVLLLLTIATTLLAGSYPAFYLSGFIPAEVLKGRFSTPSPERWARKGLVVFQFALTVMFIASAFVVYKQIDFIQTKNLGYNKDNVIYFEAEGKVAEKADAFIAELKHQPGIVTASSMMGNIVSKMDGGGMPGSIDWNGKRVTMNSSLVNYELLELLDIQVKAGRTFSRDFPSDVDKVIFNEAAIDAFGIEDPVGKIVGGNEIIGVVKDFHYQSFHEEVKPYAFRLEPQSATTIMVRIDPGATRQTLARLQQYYEQFNPGYSFTFAFLDEDYRAQYVAEKRVSTLSGYATGLVIIISCLGLFGLIAFTVERRDKEIAIRKVLGSSEAQIVFLLSGDFMKMILVAIVIAVPASFFLMTSWLDGFAYRIDLKFIYFIAAAGLALLLAWLTVGIQTWKAAAANPVKRLRSE